MTAIHKCFYGLLLTCLALPAQTLPGTRPLRAEGDLGAQMVEGIDRYLMRELAASVRRRPASPDREHLRTIIGAVDPRVPFESPALDVNFGHSARIAQGAGYDVYAIRWPVFPGVDGEGLLLEPARPPVARVVALPDADQTPEMMAGLEPGIAPAAQFARRLAESGCEVVVPVLIDRKDTWSGNPAIKKLTNQPHREFIYRMAYEMGRHIIGYEVEKVQAAVDWFARAGTRRPIGVIGYGEGGLVAFYSAAIDTRIDAAAVSGYLQPREDIWEEPIYRNVWGQLRGFGDAQIAGLIAPRALVVDAARAPEIAGPPAETNARRGAAPGRITTPEVPAVEAEVGRARPFFEKAGAGEKLSFVGRGDVVPAFGKALGVVVRAPARTALGQAGMSTLPRQHRQFDQLVDYTQALVRQSEFVRQAFQAKGTVEDHRKYYWEEVIGKLPPPSEPMTAETRRIYDEAKWTGYEVKMPVWPDVFAYGILLLPKDLKPGERRPVVVCQHGLEGRPTATISADEKDAHYYQQFAVRLVERGFVVYAPQNPYLGEYKFRVLLRKAHPLGLTLYSFIVGQHQRTLDWLAEQPFVDPARIGFYGLSYGGKTAMRVPALVDRYALSICSGDFNEWIWKVARYDHPVSYMYTREFDMLEFNAGNTFNYSDVAMLIAPRPFMVERGHADGVGIDEWVSYEYAKVRRAYAMMGIPEKTEIEYFNGPHQVHNQGTFRFLERWLNWPPK